jgi:phosphoesterase RecJ-like protein
MNYSKSSKRTVRPPADLLSFLKTGNNFLILTHMDPDADGLGCALALSRALRKKGKRTFLLDKDPVPPGYQFLPGHGDFHTPETMRSLGIGVGSFENMILLDCNHLERVVGAADRAEFDRFQGTVAVIDHHQTEKIFGHIRWVEPDIAATGIMIHALIRGLGVRITADMATNLYAAIALDTGNFRFENTTAEVLRTAASLTMAGARPHVIITELYELWSRGRFMLFREVLNTLEVHSGVSVAVVTRAMLEETGTTSDDTETFVSFPRIMRDVRVSILLKEVEDNHFRVSLRSKGATNVARIAEHFGGGGHANAAGCRMRGSAETVKSELLARCRELQDLE